MTIPPQAILPASLFDPEALKNLTWEPFRDGIVIHWLYRTPDNGPAAAILRYQPGATVPRHRHQGYEHVIILEGSQTDAAGTCRAGALSVNAPGSEHAVISRDGCLALLIWERPPLILD